jgi:hypothetical protein
MPASPFDGSDELGPKKIRGGCSTRLNTWINKVVAFIQAEEGASAVE